LKKKGIIMRMQGNGNPLLNENAFRGMTGPGSETMTQKGAYTKTAILLALAVVAATFTFTPQGAVYTMPGFIVGFILAMVTIFKKNWAMVTAPLYAICEGAALGGISYMYNAQYQGIVFNAVSLTFGVFTLMLFMYSFEFIKVTDGLRKGLFAATGAIMLVYLVGFVMSFFGSGIPMIHDAGPIGIGFSLVVVGIASFNLLIDFDFIERVAESRTAPKYMEWFAGFTLMVTLVWLYIEMLRLLSKLRER
jgi:uncharacterized YccA/Bax inhibitor family protein